MGPAATGKKGREEWGPVKKGVIAFLVAMTGVTGVTFTYKLYEFFKDLTNEDGLRFAGSHLVTYLLVAVGFLLLLVFAFLKGHFSDIERPKYDLLEREKEYDRRENP